MTNPDENKEAFYNQLASVLSGLNLNWRYGCLIFWWGDETTSEQGQLCDNYRVYAENPDENKEAQPAG